LPDNCKLIRVILPQLNPKNAQIVLHFHSSCITKIALHFYSSSNLFKFSSSFLLEYGMRLRENVIKQFHFKLFSLIYLRKGKKTITHLFTNQTFHYTRYITPKRLTS